MDIRNLLDESYRKNKRLWLKRLRHGKVTPEMAEDALQNACVRAIVYSYTYDTDKDFTDWFSRILRNALMDVLAQERRGGIHVEYKEEVDVREYADTQNFDVVAKAMAEIEKLPEPRREICRLYFLFGMTPREIEQVVENNNKSIRDIIFRFKKHLKETYGT